MPNLEEIKKELELEDWEEISEETLKELSDNKAAEEEKEEQDEQ